MVTPSTVATEWSESVGIEFCEVESECNAHLIRLVYSGIQAEPWDPTSLEGERRGD